MAIPFNEKKRQVIPRWRRPKSAANISEQTSIGTSTGVKIYNIEHLAKKIEDWKRSHSLSFATDLVGTALVLRNKSKEPLKAAEFILKPKSGSTYTAKSLASRLQLLDEPQYESNFLPPLDKADIKWHIHEIRARLHRTLNNALAWGDLAFAYGSIGLKDPAERSLRIALALAPNNRYLIRSSARFYTHTDEPDKALHILRSSPLLSKDPWLVAAEIAVSNRIGESPKTIKLARSFIESGNFSPFNLSELAGALATIELENGRDRISKKLFRQSLIDPTENVLAQAEWVISHSHLHLDIEPEYLDKPWSYEARSYNKLHNGEWSEALNAALFWLFYQPFSPSAAVSGSYTAGVGLDEHEKAIGITKYGLIANPTNPSLINNLLFSLGCAGRMAEAEIILVKYRKIVDSHSAPSAMLATKGLLHFRRGEIEEGRILYSSAIERFRSDGDRDSEIMALLFWSREELLCSSPQANTILEKALNLAKNSTRKDVQHLIKKLEELTFNSD